MTVVPRSPSSRLSRRTLIGGSLAGVALAHLAPPAVAVPSQGGPGGVTRTPPREPARWRPWLRTAPEELRPAARADPTETELTELVQMQPDRDDATIALIQKWNSRPAVLPWTE